MATEPIETHLHRSSNWENAAPGPTGPRGVRITAGTAYRFNAIGRDRKSTDI